MFLLAWRAYISCCIVVHIANFNQVKHHSSRCSVCNKNYDRASFFLSFFHICCVSSFYTNKNLWSGMSRLETSSQLTCFPNIECFLQEKIRTLDLWGLLEMSFRWRNKRLFNRLLNLMLYKVSCINFNLWLKILLLHIPLEKSWKLFSNILRKRCVWNTQNNGSIKSFQTTILFQHFFFPCRAFGFYLRCGLQEPYNGLPYALKKT